MTLFTNQMTRLDKNLYLQFDRVIERYVVWRRDRQNKPRQILVIEDDHGQFSYPTYHHLEQLHQMDSWQNKQLINNMDQHNDNLDQDSQLYMRRLHNEISKLTTRSAYF